MDVDSETMSSAGANIADTEVSSGGIVYLSGADRTMARSADGFPFPCLPEPIIPLPTASGMTVKDDAFLRNFADMTGVKKWIHSEGWDDVEHHPELCFGLTVSEPDENEHKHATQLVMPNNNVQGRVDRLNDEGWLRRTVGRGYGFMPDSLGNLKHLTVVDLSHNHISGELPYSVFDLPLLDRCDLSHNEFFGVIPESLGRFRGRIVLLQSNALTGPLPSSMGGATALEHCDMSRNKLTGPISPTLGGCTSLRTMLLHDNSIAGVLPASFGGLKSIEVFKAQNNRIQGALPSSIGSCKNLRLLWLQCNMLHGVLPTTLGECDQLVELRLSSNRLRGPLPSTLFDELQHLQRLWLSFNIIDGTIPARIGCCKSLHELLLDHNRLEGRIPREIAGCCRLELLSLVSNPAMRGTTLDTDREWLYETFGNNRFCAHVDPPFSVED